MENENRVSLRNILAREMVSNILMHCELISSYAAKFVIQKERMYTENANRALREGLITPDNLEPNPKNPIIASFFRNIGRADRLGSGVRNLFKYSKFYSEQDPEFQDGDVFRIIVPLDEEYSFDYGLSSENHAETDGIIDKTATTNGKTDGKTDGKKINKLSDTECKIIDLIKDNPLVTQKQLANMLSLSDSGIRYAMRGLKEKGLLQRSGSHRNGVWHLNS